MCMFQWCECSKATLWVLTIYRTSEQFKVQCKNLYVNALVNKFEEILKIKIKIIQRVQTIFYNLLFKVPAGKYFIDKKIKITFFMINKIKKKFKNY